MDSSDDVLVNPVGARTLDFRHIKTAYYARDDRGLMRVVTRDGTPFNDRNSIQTSTVNEGKRQGTRGTGMVGTAKQIRARARRRLAAGERLMDEHWEELYKPLEEWDAEELARGRPRSANGKFTGPPPRYLTREIHERAMERFKTLIRSEMNSQSITALRTIQMVLESEEVDNRGKPIVSASAKMDAAKFLLEHIVGKPVQPTQSDISVKLQGILGQVMVNPAEMSPGEFAPAHTGTRELPGAVYDAEVVDDEDEDNDGGE